MKKHIYLSIALLIFTSAGLQALDRQPAANPQLKMVGARGFTLETNTTLDKELSSVFLNPAVIASIDKSEFSFTNYKLFGQIDNMVLNTCFNYKDFVFGISFGSQMLTGIPETILDEERIRQIDSFSSGWRVLQGTLAKTFYNVFDLGQLSLGTNIKMYEHVVMDSSQYAYGLDAGALFSMPIHSNKFFNKLSLGASFINLYSSRLSWPDSTDTCELQKNLLVGAQINAGDNLSFGVQNTIDNEIALSIEGSLEKSLYLRLASSPDFGKFNLLRKFNVGVGLNIAQIAGFGDDSYSMRIDYCYALQTAPMDTDPTHVISVSILGETRLGSPKILSPTNGFTTHLKTASLSGIGPENVRILLFNNDVLVRTINSDRYGKWTLNDFPLKEGINRIFIKSSSLENETSLQSEKLTIMSDNTAPKLDLTALPYEDKLLITAITSEELASLTGSYDNNTLLIFHDTGENGIWLAETDFPNELKNNLTEMKSIIISAEDKAGNKSAPIDLPIFLKLKNPKDKSIVYKDSIVFTGLVSKMISEMTINNQNIKFDNQLGFSTTFPLKLGKNSFSLSLKTLNNKTLDNKVRILNLKTFRDIRTVKEKDQIEFLATLDLLPFTTYDYFYPDQTITRIDLAKYLIKLLNLTVPQEITNDLLKDIKQADPNAPFVQAIINSGLMVAFVDGTFKPNQEITVDNLRDSFVYAGLLETTFGSNTNIATRKDFAKALASSTKYKGKIAELIDWEQGF